jgi:transcriptional regulator with GAF, ATPase, and Fis domain
MSFPLMVDKTSVGAMNLYSYRERAFGNRDRESGELFAAQASIVLANAQAYWDAQDLSRGLSEAMHSRAVIEQAKGILMAPGGIDEDAAFELLVRASQRENTKLRDVAAKVVANAVARAEQPAEPDKV